MKRAALVMVAVCAINASAMYEPIVLEDGQSHEIGYVTSPAKDVFLDQMSYGGTAPNPGTHLNLVSGGAVGAINLHNHSSLTLNGGTASNISADACSSVIINGGQVIFWLFAGGESTMDIYGGTFGQVGDLTAWAWSTVSLYGSDFKVNGHSMAAGGSVTSYAAYQVVEDLGRPIGRYTGTITGTLQDGSSFEKDFEINRFLDDMPGAQAADIVLVVPEPATMLLLGLGSFVLRRKK